MANFNSDTVILMNFDYATTHSPTEQYNRTWTQGTDALRLDTRHTATDRGADYADNNLGNASAYFYGSANQYLHITEPLTPVKDITISFQFKLFTADTSEPVLFIMSSTAEGLNYTNANQICFMVEVNTEGQLIVMRTNRAVILTKNVNLLDNEWHSLHMYINSSGKLAIALDSALSTSTTYTIGTISSSMYIGFNMVGRRWNGYLDNFRIQKGLDTSYPIAPFTEDIPFPDFGTVQKDQVLTNAQISSMADGGQNFSWDSTNHCLVSGRKTYMVQGYTAQAHFTCTPKTKLTMSITFSAYTVSYQYCYIKIYWYNSSNQRQTTNVWYASGCNYTDKVVTCILQKDIEYEIEFTIYCYQYAAPTQSNTNANDYTANISSKTQRFQISRIEFLQAFEPVDLSYIDDGTSFDLTQVSDGAHYSWDSTTSRLQSSENSYHVASGYSKACIRFMPTSTGHITIRYGISSQSGQDIGAIYIQEAGEEDSDGNMTWYDFFEPTLTQAKAGTVPTNSYNLRHIVHISGTVTEATVDVPVSAGVYYALGIYYIKNASTDTGDDRFYIYDITMYRETSEYQYMSYIRNGTHQSIPLGLTGSDRRLAFVNEGEVYTTNALPSGNSSASPLHLPYQSQDYTGEKDLVTVVPLPSMVESEFEYAANTTRTVQYDYDSEHVLVIGTKSAINAGTYQLIFVLKNKDSYRWSSGGTENKMSGYTWRIKKAKTTISYSETEVTIDKGHEVTKPITKSHGEADYTVTSENTAIAKVSRYGPSYSLFTVIGEEVGTTRIKLQIKGDDNYEESNVVTITVNVVPKIWRWSEIATMIGNGTIENTFPVGSQIIFPMKSFTLAGAGTNSYEISEGSNYYLQVLGYNHNPDKEMSTKSVSLQIMSTVNDNDHSVTLYKGAMDTNNTSTKWIGTNMRNTNMANILEAIDSQKYSSIRYNANIIYTSSLDKSTVCSIKYINTGSDISAKSYERIVEHIYIPAHTEISGASAHVTADAEKAYTQQFQYYKQGGTQKRTYYNGSDQLGTTSAEYWTRSSNNSDNKKCTISTSGGSSSAYNNAELGVTPVFNLCGNSFWCLSWEQIRYLAENDMLTDICTSTSTKYVKHFSISTGPFTGSYAAVLIDINHNPDLEGHGFAHFEIARVSGTYGSSNKISFYDNSLGSVGETGTYRHKEAGTEGGWRSSELRARLEEFYGYLPEDLKEQIVPCPKYTDNVGDSTDNESNISCTSDELWLMSEIECGITGGYSNSHMSSYTQVYNKYGVAYTSTNSTRIKRKYNNASSNTISDYVMTWLRDPDKSSFDFCLLERSGAKSTGQPDMSYGIAPCFAVGGQKYAVVEHNGTKTEISWTDLRDRIIAGTHSLSLGDIVWFPMRSFNLIQSNLVEKKIHGGMFGARVIGINHNSSIEGNNRVHFQICRYSGISKNICFNGSIYNNVNSGTLYESVLYQESLQNIFAALPRNLQKVITPVKKNGRYEVLFLPSLKEVLGTTTYDTNSEQVRYQQLSTNSNNVLYAYDGDTQFGTTATAYWTRDLVSINTNGSGSSSNNRTNNRAISPCFTIGASDTISNTSITVGGTTITLTQLASYIKGGTIQNYLTLGDVIPINFSDIMYKVNDTDYACIRAGVYGARVIGFNHNSSIEGNNTVHFQICALGNQKISFMGAPMNSTSSKTGGYKSATIMKGVMLAFYGAMPSEWKKIIDTCTKYTDRGQSGNDSTGNTFSEYLWLPSFTELFGTVSSASSMLNTVEKNKNVQYDLFKGSNYYWYHNYRAYDGDIYNGDFKRKIWTRSTSISSDQYIAVFVDDCQNITPSTNDATESLAFTPCFMISGAKATQTVTPPTVTNTSLTYTGSSQGPTITNRDSYSSYMSFTNDTGINAGDYTLQIGLTNPVYTWKSTVTYNHDTGCVEVPWTITKAAGSLTLSASTVSLTNTTKNISVTITRSGDGTISVESTNPLVATAVLNGTVLQISGLSNGTTTIRVSVAEGNNYLAVAEKTISVSVNLDTAAGSLTWNQISQYSNAGTLSNYISQYDTKEVTLNGTVGELTFNDAVYKAVCLSPLENDTLENETTIKTSHWAILKNSEGKNICFTNDNYSSTSSELDKFAHKQTVQSSKGGWEVSDIRRRLQEEFLVVLPSDLIANIVKIAKYTNNGDSTEDLEEEVTPTYDALWIPAIGEMTRKSAPDSASITPANLKETSHNPRYLFFDSVTPSATFYRHNNTSVAAITTSRSRHISSDLRYFSAWDPSVSSNYKFYYGIFANRSVGIIPCFAIGGNSTIDFTTKTAGQTYTFGLGSYTINSSAQISTENGILHNLNGVMPITYNDGVKNSTKYSVTVEVKFVSNQGTINQGIFYLCAMTNLKGFRFKSQQNYRLSLGTSDLVGDSQYTFNTNTWYKIEIKIIDQTVTWTVNDTWSLSASMISTFTIGESCANLFEGYTAGNSTYVRSLSFAILD